MSSLQPSTDATQISIKEIFPAVISASRATDIPAFHAKWFMDHLRAGSCEWQNPFNACQRQLVNFSKTRAIVFWSKNPATIIKYLEEIEATGKKFYFQFTLNDYPEDIEPYLPSLEERIQTFRILAGRYKVIWRYDPILMGDQFTVKRHLRIIENLMTELSPLTEKLVFSFIDIYGKVKSSLRKINPEFRAPYLPEMREFCLNLAELRDKHAPRLKLATCAEADLDFESMNIHKNSCIDSALINDICSEEIFPAKKTLLGTQFEKDKGQRNACGCAPSKDIGSYHSHPCGHNCIYCYAGHTGRQKVA